MNTVTPTRRSPEPRAFTLIELLVVITIIAVLAGLLLPVVQKVTQNAYKASAKTTETQIIAAVNAYQTEYGQYPVVVSTTTTTPTDTTFGIDSTTHNYQLFNVLRAINANSGDATAALNTRQIVYFESKNVKNSVVPKDGFIATGSPTGNRNVKTPVTLSVGDLVDPWGNMYLVRIDTNYSNAVQNPYYTATVTAIQTDSASDTASTTSTDVLRTGVIAWSWGYDGLEGNGGATIALPYSPTPGDDVDSWQ